MTGQLQHVDDDGPTRCVHCARDAAGPCAACRRPVCGECSTLTEGGAKVWAICLACERKGGRSLSSALGGLGLWLVLGLLGLAATIAVLEHFWPSRE